MTKEENDLVWLAGFIDGDGCVHLGKGKLSAQVGWVEICQKLTGVLGSILQMCGTYNLPLPCIVEPYNLRFNSHKGARLLEQLVPYFRHPRHIIRAPLYLEFYKVTGKERVKVHSRWLEAKEYGYEDAPVPGWPEDEDLPYLAGFFEAEGCINIGRLSLKTGQLGGIVTISQKSPVMLQRVVEVVSRQGLPVPRLYSTSGNGLVFNRLKGKTLLEKLLPFMHHPEKIARAEFYIKFFNTNGRLQKGIKQKLYEEEWLDLRATGRPG